MKFQDFKQAIERPYFTVSDIRIRGLSVSSPQLSMWKDKKYIAPLKRGAYYFIEERSTVDPLRTAQILYEPSYVSNEYALRLYGFIPEMVHAVTSVTTKANRKFSNDFGTFLYRHIKAELFFGYRIMRTDIGGKYFMAEPEKAVLDYCYLNLGRLGGKSDIQALRINRTEFMEKINREKFLEYREVYDIQKLNRVTDILLNLC